MNLTVFGKRLQKSRRQCGYSAAGAAGTLAINLDDWRAFERGEKMPDARQFVAMASLFRVDPWWLGDEKPQPVF